jgi:formylglycine-generating enzyme required for sulfatase activity
MNHEPAQQQVERFVRRFEPSYRRLAYYAALPLVLTPELVNYLRCQFLLKDGVPWVAEADLLLSDLCNPVGYEQYAIDPAVRAYLLSEMETTIGRGQMQLVARLLLSYIRQLAQANPETLWQKELDNQQMAAMVYLDDQRESVVQRLAEAYQDCAAVGKISTEMAQAIQAKLDQLVRMTQEMAPQLRDYPALVAYAELLRRLLDEPQQVEANSLEQRFEVTPGVELMVPSVLVPRETRVDLGDNQWQTFEYEVVTIAFEEDGDRDDDLDIHAFEFDIATVVVEEKRRSRNKVRELVSIQRRPGQAWQFIERLTDKVVLEMVSIPAGEFLMGSPPEEPERFDNEGPQHLVTIPSFCIGKYPVTQAQWRFVAGLPKVNQGFDPNPANFGSDDYPVVSVSWFEATEFCARLSQLTGRDYRLPSEAEWEYACRAGTTSPFHFGETITPELANYDWDKTYAEIKVTKKKNFQGTTAVGQFGVANAFGLYDMHGNVWEWCLDHWHDNYEGAPTDGNAWLSDGKGAYHLLRGGSWDLNPRGCRSAVRNDDAPGFRLSYFGFRVVCSAARIPS